MSAADKLAQVIAEHTICWNGSYSQYECTEGDATYESAEHCDAEVDHAAHIAAVVLAHLTAEGWAQGAEEWGVRYTTHMGPVEHEYVDEAVARIRYEEDRLDDHFPAVALVRRRVTDWEPAETGDQK